MKLAKMNGFKFRICETTDFRGRKAVGKSFPRGKGFRIGSSIYGFVRWEKVSQTAQPSNIQYIIICET